MFHARGREGYPRPHAVAELKLADADGDGLGVLDSPQPPEL